MDLNKLIIEFIFLLIMANYIFKMVIEISFNHNWIDIPDFERKIHNKKIPNSGGLVVLLFMLAGVLPIIKYFGATNVQILSVGLTYLILAFTGWIDDREILSFRIRLIIQTALTFINLIIVDWKMDKFLSPFFLNNILPEPFTFLFLSLFIVGAINAINWWDGVNGNLGFWLIQFTIALFFIIPFSKFDSWLFLLVFSIHFIYYNFFKVKIFMGDVGSTPIGFILSYLTLQILQRIDLVDLKNISNFKPEVLITLVWCLPFFDLIRLTLLRTLKGVSPALADQNHFHHYAFKIFKNHGVFFSVIIYFVLFMLQLIKIGNMWEMLMIALLIYSITLVINFNISKNINPIR